MFDSVQLSAYSNRPLVVAANRDEVHERASQAAMFWEDDLTILAGRDLVAGGTWLGCIEGSVCCAH